MKSRSIKGIENHSDEWIALDEGKTRIIGWGKNFTKVYNEANKKAKKPVLMKVPRLDSAFVGRCL